ASSAPHCLTRNASNCSATAARTVNFCHKRSGRVRSSGPALILVPSVSPNRDGAFDAPRETAMRCLNRNDILDYVRMRRAFFDAASATNPFVGSDWLERFIEHVAQDDWRFIAPEHRDETSSLMLLYSRADDPQRWFSVTNHYASLYTPLIGATQQHAAVARVLAERITRETPDCISINCAPLDGDAAGTVALERAFAEQGWHTKRYSCFGNWYLPCAGLSFERYLHGRDAMLRTTVARKTRRFELGEDGARLVLLSTPAEVEAGMAAYERLRTRSW